MQVSKSVVIHSYLANYKQEDEPSSCPTNGKRLVTNRKRTSCRPGVGLSLLDLETRRAEDWKNEKIRWNIRVCTFFIYT